MMEKYGFLKQLRISSGSDIEGSACAVEKVPNHGTRRICESPCIYSAYLLHLLLVGLRLAGILVN